ncbi:hypothetical protein PENSPDRAFT_690653 [Peniophora sp. CONT]|nr:hypothetical protein PENSPDRAFT_690653 [Peniophora sp. CONT]
MSSVAKIALKRAQFTLTRRHPTVSLRDNDLIRKEPSATLSLTRDISTGRRAILSAGHLVCSRAYTPTGHDLPYASSRRVFEAALRQGLVVVYTKL